MSLGHYWTAGEVITQGNALEPALKDDLKLTGKNE